MANPVFILEIKPHKWEKAGKKYSSDFFPFVNGEPRHDIADCQSCAFYVPEGKCSIESSEPDEKRYLFCGNICGYYALIKPCPPK